MQTNQLIRLDERMRERERERERESLYVSYSVVVVPSVFRYHSVTRSFASEDHLHASPGHAAPPFLD